jgi:hypothetical protein
MLKEGGEEMDGSAGRSRAVRAPPSSRKREDLETTADVETELGEGEPAAVAETVMLPVRPVPFTSEGAAAMLSDQTVKLLSATGASRDWRGRGDSRFAHHGGADGTTARCHWS